MSFDLISFQLIKNPKLQLNLAANILLNSDGNLVLTDFGLARPLDERKSDRYTPNVVTRFYRAPEIQLGMPNYNCAIDMWSYGCIVGEIYSLNPLFMSNDDIGHFVKIMELIGTPMDVKTLEFLRSLPDYNKMPLGKHFKSRLDQFFTLNSIPKEAQALIKSLLNLSPQNRMKIKEALISDYFWSPPRPLIPRNEGKEIEASEKEMLPKYPSSLDYYTQSSINRRLITGKQNKSTTALAGTKREAEEI